MLHHLILVSHLHIQLQVKMCLGNDVRHPVMQWFHDFIARHDVDAAIL
jgi:hypothetical protein